MCLGPPSSSLPMAQSPVTHNTLWARLTLRGPWLMEDEDVESPRDPCAILWELPARNSSSAASPGTVAPAPREHCTLVSLWWKWPLAAFPCSGQERSGGPHARPAHSPKASSSLSLQHAIRSPHSCAQDHSVRRRAEMSAVLRMAALAVPTITQRASGCKTPGGRHTLLPPVPVLQERPADGMMGTASAGSSPEFSPGCVTCELQAAHRAHSMVLCPTAMLQLNHTSTGRARVLRAGHAEASSVHCFPFHVHIPPTAQDTRSLLGHHSLSHVSAVFKGLPGLLSGQSHVQRELPSSEWVACKDMEPETRTPAYPCALCP